MVEVTLIPRSEFKRVRSADIDIHTKIALLSDMNRANTLVEIKRAGSGHLGSSLSSLDIVTWLFESEMNTVKLGIEHPDRDIYFSSKGHDVPGLYAVLYAVGILPEEKLLALRRLDGLEGHPNVNTIGIEANSGSLGMGISKAKGMVFAKQRLGRLGRVFVMTGDGELQEGQNYEALQTAVYQGITNLIVIVDHNKVQTDRSVVDIAWSRDMESKFLGFGWHVERCNGHDFRELGTALRKLSQIKDKPKILIADTIKGRGISFMEHPTALKKGGGYYRWHSGAPDDESFKAAHPEIVERLNNKLTEIGLAPIALKKIPPQKKIPSTVSKEYVADAYGKALVEIAAERNDIVVLDADLAADCRVREFELTYPGRFIENGIAEQDMVSMAGGLALQGMLPVVNSFANFLAGRANEQIYINSCEHTKIIYVCHYAGLIPAGPGLSHQSVRDISLLGTLSNFEIIQPCNSIETRIALDYCINRTENSTVLRLIIGPSPRLIKLPEGYQLTFGQGIELTHGDHAILFGYGPVMLHEALSASEKLAKQGFGLKVVNMPWLNRVNAKWLADIVAPYKSVYVIEDHSPIGGLADHLVNILNQENLLKNRRVIKFGVEGYPACGTPVEALKHHSLDAISLVDRIITTRRSWTHA